MSNKGFTIRLKFKGKLTKHHKDVFNRASKRWEEIIQGTEFGTPICLDITAIGKPIDGPGQILGRAGPTRLSITHGLPIEGMMQFDTYDLSNMEKNGTLEAVILHEMGHVLGFGTLWGRKRLIEKSGTSNPVYVGKKAMVEYATLLGTDDEDDLERPIPIANTGGSGTREGHWRESIFDYELMTGYTEETSEGTNNVVPDMPISRMTIASLEDLGYAVNYAKADTYNLPKLRHAVTGTSSEIQRQEKLRHYCYNVEFPNMNIEGDNDGGRRRKRRFCCCCCF